MPACFRRERLPEKDYALGETLPPHLSPFVADRRVGDYIPPEEKKLLEAYKKDNEKGDQEEDGEEEDEEEEEEGEEEEEEDEDDDEEDDEEEEEESDKEEGGKENQKMGVRLGKAEKVDEGVEKKKKESEEYR